MTERLPGEGEREYHARRLRDEWVAARGGSSEPTEEQLDGIARAMNAGAARQLEGRTG